VAQALRLDSISGFFFKADNLGEIWNYFFIMHYSARVGLSVVRTSSKELLFA